MNSQIKNFLVAIIGPDGQNVVERLCKNSEDLESVIVPRALMSWMYVLSNLDKFEGNVPGTEASQIKITKTSNKTFSGEIKYNDKLYKFENDTILKIAATLAVNLDIDMDNISKNIDKNKLAVLGKTLDLITKSKFIAQRTRPIKKSEFEVVLPIKQIKTIPTLKKRSLNKSIAVSYEEMAKYCAICGNKQFDNNIFKGCTCLKAMAKNTATIKTDNGCSVTFRGKEWDNEALSAFLRIIKG